MDATDKSSKKSKKSAETTQQKARTIAEDVSCSRKKKKVKVSTIRRKKPETENTQSTVAVKRTSKKADDKSVDKTADDRSTKKPRKNVTTRFKEGIFKKKTTTKENTTTVQTPPTTPPKPPIPSPKKPDKLPKIGQSSVPVPAKKVVKSKESTASTGSSDGDESVKVKASVRQPKKNVLKTLETTKDSEADDGTQIGSTKKKKGPSGEQGSGGTDGYDKQLAAFVKETIKTGVPKLVKDFHEARATAPKTMPKTAFEKNADKNRYKDVICMDETRVVLKWPADNPNDYIHANWVQVRGEKRYICTQGPTTKTVDDFWRLVFQEKCKGIVMLTEVMELGKKKCEQYWPKAVGETMTSGLCTIVNKKVIEVEKMLISTQLEVTANGETLKCEHVLWTGWPDRGVPDNYLATLRLVRKMAPFSPCLVHCSAGIGRTGTIVGLDLCQRTLQAGEKLDMHEICKELRKYRHGSVQTDVQFIFMHAVILKLAENRKAGTREQMKPFFDEYTAYVSTRQ